MTEDHSALTPFLGSLVTALVRNSDSRSKVDTRTSFDRTLGATATLGLSLVILRLVAHSVKVSKGDKDEKYHDDSDWANLARKLCFTFFRSVLRRVLLQDEKENHQSEKHEKENQSSEHGEEDTTPIIHGGSCHCQSVEFQVIAPRSITLKEGPGKIQYPHVTIMAQNFHLLRGNKYLRMYYINRTPEKAINDIAAHAFCARCGVHLLFAPSSRSSEISINLNCLGHSNIRVVKKSSGDNGSFCNGIPMAGQWVKRQSERSQTNGEAELSLAMTTPSVSAASEFQTYKYDPHNQNIINLDDTDPPSAKESYICPDTPLTVASSSTTCADFFGTGAFIPSVNVHPLNFDQESADDYESTASSVMGACQGSLSIATSASLLADKAIEKNSRFPSSTAKPIRDNLQILKKYMQSDTMAD